MANTIFFFQSLTPLKNLNSELRSLTNSPFKNENSPIKTPTWSKTIVTPLNKNGTPSSVLEGNSNSSWAEMESYVIGNIQIYPPTLATRQMLILRFVHFIHQTLVSSNNF